MDAGALRQGVLCHGDVTHTAAVAQMHTLAAHYPRSPSLYEQAHAANFFRAVAALYPCTHCRDDFHAAVAHDPPRRVTAPLHVGAAVPAPLQAAEAAGAARRVESRESLAVWLCGQHNVVNKKLGKPLFPCDFAALDARWRTGAPGCFPEGAESAAESLGQE